MSSDNIPTLCYTSNLNAAAIVYTEKYICGQYISLNIVVKSDAQIYLSIQFSGDGTNWDLVTNQLIDALSNKIISSPVQAKWVRLEITNTDTIASTYLRVYTYGTPNNSSILAQLTKIGGINPTVNIGNIPPDFYTPYTVQNYKFNSGVTATPTIFVFTSLYPTLYLLHSGIGAGATFGFDDNVLTLATNNSTVNDYIYDYPIPIVTPTFSIILTAKWTATTNCSTGGVAIVGCSSNYNDIFGIGYYKITHTFTYNDWGLYLLQNGILTFVPRSSFNVDTMNGTAIIPTLDLTKINMFKLIISNISIDFYVFYGGQFVLCHQHKYTSIYPMIQDWSFGYVMNIYRNQVSTATTGNLSVSCGSWSLQFLGRSQYTDIFTPTRSLCYEATKNAVTTETNVLTLKNNNTYLGSGCYRSLVVSGITISKKSTVSVVFKIYSNAVINTPVYTDINNYTNAQYLSSGTFVSATRLIGSYTLGLATLQLPIEIFMKTLDTITITASGTSAVDVSVSLHIE